jgi:hypothetical protein
MVVIVEGGKEVPRKRKKKRPVPEFIDPVFAKTSPKTSFSITENERNQLLRTYSIQILKNPLKVDRIRFQLNTFA